MNNITASAKQIKEDVKNSLKSQAVQHVALSVDCWSFNSRKYIGIIAHWLNDELERHSSAIALRSLKRQLAYDMLAEIILQVCHEYDIQKKVVSIVSDSASNLNRSFSILGNIEDSEWEEEDSDHDEDIVDIEPILEDENNEFLPLPMHHRCVCHSLDLIVTEDAQKAEFSAGFRNQKKITFPKCLAFWKKQSRSIHAPDMIKAIVGCYLKVPNITSWHSVYHSMETLAVVMQNKCDSLNLVCDYLEIPHFTETDVLFLKEYTMVMQPICKATDTLQQDKDMHMGCVLPTLTCLKRRLQAIERESMQYCHSFATACLNGIKVRFGDMLNDRSFLMAALTHPKFKLKWIENKDQKDDALQLLKQEIRQRSSDQVTLWSGVMKKEDTDILFEDFESSAGDHELEMFLSNVVKDVQCLNSVPIMKDMFITYNTSLPSSRPAEGVGFSGLLKDIL
ncbi:hypothetical protein J437_LFUL012854 [Ladona fulva]|uniref:Transposase n=1 Tax=Ladona fulva TaxID=123851 RepID=A0A8K0KHJ7_LADFU|nr:hypothetical protein J437_LFUL012854 [Ladona fulva]